MENINAKTDSSSELDSKANLLNLKAKERGVSPEEFKAQIAKDNDKIPSSIGVPELVKTPRAEPNWEHIEAALKLLKIDYRCNCDVGFVKEFKQKEGDAEFSEWSESQLLEVKQRIIQERMTYLKTSTKKAGEVEVDLKFTTENFNQSVSVLMEREKAYPFREYLQTCATEPFSDITLENWLFDALKVEDTPLNRWASKLIFLSVIQRVFEPGCEQRVTPFLIGNPGIGKSSLVRFLLPQAFKKYFSDNLSFTQNHKERIEQTSNHLLIEIGELGGFSRADRNDLKAYLTRQIDIVRFAYEKQIKPMPRKFALIGTGNPDAVGIIKDDGLLDRIIVIKCNANKYHDMEKFLDDHRDHLWKLAYNEYIEGTRVHDIPGELKSAQFESSEPMVYQDEIMNEALHNMSNDLTQDELEAGFTLNQIADMLKFNKVDNQGNRLTLPKSDQMRLTNALKSNNWKREHKENVNVWLKGVK